MKFDPYGQAYTNSEELFELLYKEPELVLDKFLVEDPEEFNTSSKRLYSDFPQLKKYIQESNQNIEEFDLTNQEIWFMPDTYKNLDIAQWLINQCSSEEETQRVLDELLLYHERNLFPLLRFLKYLVDTMRANNLVWGVGRGSSVSSFILYLIGVHKINSIKYDLKIEEFLK